MFSIALNFEEKLETQKKAKGGIGKRAFFDHKANENTFGVIGDQSES